MKNNIKRFILVILIFILIAGTTFFIFRKKIIARFTPQIEQFGDIHILVKNDTSFISSKLVIKNRSFLKITMDTIRYKVSLFDKQYIENQRFLGVVLPAYGSDSLDFSVKIPYMAILRKLKIERQKIDSASYTVNVDLQYATVFGKSKMPINKSAKIKIPQPPEIKIEELKWKKLHFKSVHADVKIKILNNTPVALSVKKMSYSMTIPKQGNLKGIYTEVINIKPKGITSITVPIDININNLGRTLFQVLLNKDIYNYSLTMNALVESTDPLKKSFSIDLTKTGKIELKK